MDREEVRQRAYKWSRDFTTEIERRLAVDLLLLLDELAARDAAIEKVWELHHPLNDNIDSPCNACRDRVWPCPTVRALSVLDSEETQ